MPPGIRMGIGEMWSAEGRLLVAGTLRGLAVMNARCRNSFVEAGFLSKRLDGVVLTQGAVYAGVIQAHARLNLSVEARRLQILV